MKTLLMLSLCLLAMMASAQEPERRAVGTILGRPVYADELGTNASATLRGRVLGKLRDDFIQKNKITVTDKDLDQFAEAMAAKMPDSAKDQSTSAEKRGGYKMIGSSFILNWKFNKALYKKYGGGLMFQQAGLEPVDAYLKFLEEAEKKKDFEIVDPELKKAFWADWRKYAKSDTKDPKKVEKYFEKPWWLWTEKDRKEFETK